MGLKVPSQVELFKEFICLVCFQVNKGPLSTETQLVLRKVLRYSLTTLQT